MEGSLCALLGGAALRRRDRRGPSRRADLRRHHADGEGYFPEFIPEAKAGDLYLFRLDGRPEMSPDPACRFQPRGPLGPSQLVDPGKFAWTDAAWKGVPREDQVL